MSESTTFVVEAIKTLGKDRIDDAVIKSLKNRLPEDKNRYVVFGNMPEKRSPIYIVHLRRQIT